MKTMEFDGGNFKSENARNCKVGVVVQNTRLKTLNQYIPNKISFYHSSRHRTMNLYIVSRKNQRNYANFFKIRAPDRILPRVFRLSNRHSLGNSSDDNK